jgi:hypothetical protein
MAIAYEEPPVRRSANEVSRAYQRGRDIVVPIADRDLEVEVKTRAGGFRELLARWPRRADPEARSARAVRRLSRAVEIARLRAE